MFPCSSPSRTSPGKAPKAQLESLERSGWQITSAPSSPLEAMPSITSTTFPWECTAVATTPMEPSGCLQLARIGRSLSRSGQFFASQLINLEWLKPGGETHRAFSASSDIQDGAGHSLVTAYPVQRPDGSWALLIINKDQDHPHTVRVKFQNSETGISNAFKGEVAEAVFGSAQYRWQPLKKIADPDGPIVRSNIDAKADTAFELPAASIVVLRGRIGD